MLSFVIKRLLYGVLVLLGVTLIVFVLFNGLGDPARLTLGQRADVSTVEAVKKELGLDKPLPERFLAYMQDILPLSIHPNTEEARKEYEYFPLICGAQNCFAAKAPYLRRSYQTKAKVSHILMEALPKTLLLGLVAITFAGIIGIFFGVIASLRQFSWVDNSILVTSILGISQPSYFSGIILALIFGYWLKDYTGLNHSGSLYGLSNTGEDILIFKNVLLPAIALGIRPIAIIVQLTRGTMLEVLSQDYVRTATAKGLSRRKVIFKHALRNALNPVVTTISGWTAALMAGAFFVEYIFNYKGLGYVTIKALETLDLPVVMGSVLFTAAVFVIVNILTDIIYGLLDPRVTLK